MADKIGVGSGARGRGVSRGPALLRAENEEKGTKGIQHSLEIEIKWFDNDQGGSLEL